jgi:hypothetical protein
MNPYAKYLEAQKQYLRDSGWIYKETISGANTTKTWEDPLYKNRYWDLVEALDIQFERDSE